MGLRYKCIWSHGDCIDTYRNVLSLSQRAAIYPDLFETFLKRNRDLSLGDRIMARLESGWYME